VRDELALEFSTSNHMASTRLPNYLRSNRKRLALSQGDIAFLMGAKQGTKVCQHEVSTRVPSLQTALAYEAIYQRPIRDLFAGIYEGVEQEIVARAEMLAEQNIPQKTALRADRRSQVLKELATRKSDTFTSPQ
jgi:DNA-binding XRE family transcriptional regulator